MRDLNISLYIRSILLVWKRCSIYIYITKWWIWVPAFHNPVKPFPYSPFCSHALLRLCTVHLIITDVSSSDQPLKSSNFPHYTHLISHCLHPPLPYPTQLEPCTSLSLSLLSQIPAGFPSSLFSLRIFSSMPQIESLNSKYEALYPRTPWIRRSKTMIIAVQPYYVSLNLVVLTL